MSRSLAESQAVNEIARLLYDFLPGKAHPYADQSICFAAVARDAGLSHLWTGGSKQPAIATLLEGTLETHRGKFCDLVQEIVHRGLKYRSGKGNPITREEIEQLNELVKRVGFKIPELWNPTFLDSLPTNRQEKEEQGEKRVDQGNLETLKNELVRLNSLSEQQRGYAFESFLQMLFEAFGLDPRSPFRLVGEQIDGSFQVGQDTYLVEAKWQNERVGQADLLVFREKVEAKAVWSRGLFISYSGFTDDGLQAFARGRSTNIVGMTGEDIYLILDGKMSLVGAINKKARWAAETGEFYVRVYDLSS